MQYTKLGNSDLSVSRIYLGYMGFGDAKNRQHSWTIGEAHSREIIKRALELGVNFFDTAIAYQSGTSEQYVGRAIRDYRELSYLEEPYVPHALVGVMAQNTASAAKESYVGLPAIKKLSNHRRNLR